MDAQRNPIDALTADQILCLQLVGEHLTSKEIAVLLGISRHTVDQRVRRALKALGVQRRSQAAQLIRVVMLSGEAASAAELPDETKAILERARFPFATSSHRKNTMSIPMRLTWIAVIALGAFGSMAVYLAGLESLARMLRAS